jgi:hypothetical protein
MCTIAKHENYLVDKRIVFGKVLDVVVNVSELSNKQPMEVGSRWSQ